jgi:electron transfer flavoprotein alpha subunit
MKKDIWVVLESERKKVKASSIALIVEGRQLADEWDGSMTAVYLGEAIPNLEKTMGAQGVDCMLALKQSAPAEHYIEINAGVLSQLVAEKQPDLVLSAATPYGSDLLSRVSAKTKSPLVTNCLEAKVDGGLKFIKPIQNGRLHATLACRGNGTRLATVIPDASIQTHDKSSEKSCRMEEIKIAPGSCCATLSVRVTGFQKADHRTIDIGEAETILAIGKGLGTVENFEKVKVFADQIGAAIGGTRPMVDAKILPYERQIGQTGKRVAPKLIFLCGISGAIEFVSGIEKAGTKLAINNDRDAPIFRSIDVGIVGDLNAVLPQIIDHLNRIKQNAPNAGA